MAHKKSYNGTLEKRVIKGMLSDKLGQQLLAKVGPEHFHTETGLEAYKRIRQSVEKRGRLPRYEDLFEDPRLPDRVKDALYAFEEKVSLGNGAAEDVFERLERYRMHRSLIELYNEMGAMLNSDDFNVEEAIPQLVERFGDIRNIGNRVKVTTIGTGDNALELVQRIIDGEAVYYIPTGFATFDDRNEGIPIGSYMMVAATTGGGKSALVKTLAMNMALRGINVAIVPLEMSSAGVLTRNLSELSGVPMEKFLNPKKRMTEEDRDAIWEEGYVKPSRRIRKAGGKLSFLEFEEDIGIQDLLLYCKPMGFRVVIIDYLGLLSGADGDDQARALGRMSRICKKWAEANNAIVIAAAQLSSDGLVRYSRKMTEDASTLWQWIYTPSCVETKSIHITQPKSRQQNPFDFNLHFDPSTMIVRDMTEEEMKALRGEREAARKGGEAKKGEKQGKQKKRFFEDLNDLE